MKYSWYAEPVPDGMTVRQVHGVLLTHDARVLIRIKNGEARLTGGRPELNETWQQTLMREAIEEANVKISEMQYLGYQVPENENYAQVRMVAMIKEILPPRADPDREGNWIYGRELLPFKQAKVRLRKSFGTIGEQLLDVVFEVAKQEKWFDSCNNATEVLNLESKDL